MRRVAILVSALALAGLLAGPAAAQQQRQRGQRGQGGMGQGGVAALLQNEGVQKELNLDQDQVDKIKDAVAKVRENHKDDYAKLQDLGQDERREKSRELNRTVNEETLTALKDVLKPEQTKRLKQIELQAAGERAFTQPDVQKALNLTEDQKEKIKTITDDAARERREALGGGNAGGGRGNFEKLAAMRKETLEKVQAVLTDDQKKTWKDMTGEPFEVRFGGRGRRNNQ